MPPDHSEITTRDGRHIPVVHKRIEGGKKRAIDVSGVKYGPRSMRELSEQLDAIVGRVNRLSPSHRNPERFHEDRSEIARDLARLAAWATREQ